MTGHHADKESKAKPTHKQQDSSASPSVDANNLLDLQRVVGNQAVQRLMAEGKLAVGSNVLQAKLTVGAPDDQYEQEADSVAQQVMTMPDTVQRDASQLDEEELPLQAKPIQRETAALDEDELPLQAKHIQRESAVDEEELPLQMKSDGGIPEVTDDIESGIEGSRGSGQTMPDSARDFFEPRFGQDFSGVQIHTGSEADSLNRSLEARAFTTGSDIYFRDGEYNPNSSGGRELLAHELTHVVQQGGSTVRRDPSNKGNTTTMDFSDEGEVIEGNYTTVGSDIDGASVANFITTEIVDRIRSTWGAFTFNYLAAIDNFQTYMSFADSHEAQAEYLETALKWARDLLLKEGIDRAKKAIPGFGEAADLVQKLFEEHERAAKAAGKVKVRDFIVKYRTDIANMNQTMNPKINALNPLIQSEFKARADTGYSDLSKPKSTSEGKRVIAGPGSEYLNTLKSEAIRWEQSIPTPDALLQKIVEGWVQRDEHKLKSKGGGETYYGGRIFLELNLIRENGQLKPDGELKKGKLASEEAAKSADALERVMKEQKININQLDILKDLTINVEDEVSGFNDHYYVYLHYRDPDDILFENGYGSPIRDEEVQEKYPQVKQQVMDFVDLNKINVTQLDPY